MGWEVLRGSTNNANAVMDYFGITSFKEFDTVMARLRAEASGFLNSTEVG